MILFFGDTSVQVFAVKCSDTIPHPQIEKLSWLFGNQPQLEAPTVFGDFYGPRATIVTPWSTNAVEISQNMGIQGIERIEFFEAKDLVKNADPMLVTSYKSLTQSLFYVEILP